MSSTNDANNDMHDTHQAVVTFDNAPEPLLALTPQLASKLQARNAEVLSHLVKTNSISTYFKESQPLQNFHNVVSTTGLDTCLEDPAGLVGLFAENVPLSTYPDYQPFVQRFQNKPCREEDVKDLFAPGIPYFLAVSSATSGKEPKCFPKYAHPPGESYEAVLTNSNPAPVNGGKNCVIFSLANRSIVEVQDNEGKKLKTLAVALVSAGAARMQHNMHIEWDSHIKSITAGNNTSPLAIAYVKEYRSFLLLHALFTLTDPDLEMMNTLFSTVFCDFARFLEEDWDILMNSIETGILPEYEGAEEVRDYLVPKFHPNPTRAAELRKVDRTQDGWMKTIWPKFRVHVTIASGIFAALIPVMRHYLGNEVIFRSLGFTTSESFVGIVYDEQDLNLFKVVGQDDIIEYLDVNDPEESKHVKSGWEVEVGGRYEVILTTRDGFWRYRLGDIIEVAGWDPRDGQPLIRYCERRNAAIRLSAEFTTEQELSKALTGLESSLGEVSEFTVVVDDRHAPAAYGYLVELAGAPGPAPHKAVQQVTDTLSSLNQAFKFSLTNKKIRQPTVRVLQPGTFATYREDKIRANGGGGGQSKVPAVVWDESTKAWLLEKVAYEV